MDLLLVNIGEKQKVYQELSKSFSAVEPPFLAALTAGFIRNKGFEVDILDANALNLSIPRTAEKIAKIDSPLVNIIVSGQQPAASTQLMGGVHTVCNIIKKLNPNIKILLTGLHPSALPIKTMNEEECDYVGLGEGFYTLLDLLDNKDLSNVRGLIYRSDGHIVSNGRTKNIDLSELYGVAWDLLPMDSYLAHNWHCLGDFENRSRYASLSTSFGCPFNCVFCSIHALFGERKIRYFNPEWVLKQIDILVKKYNVKYLKIIDELFVLNPEHFIPICDGLIERDYDLNIWAYSRIDTVKEEYLKKLKNAGFQWLCFGIESGDKKIRIQISKGTFEDVDIRNVIQQVKDAGIYTNSNYLFGLPEDDIQSMQRTLELAISLNCEFANFYSNMPYPGSELYEQTDPDDLPESWLGYSQHSYECSPLPTDHLSKIDVLTFRDHAFQTYFTNEKYLSMIEYKFGLEARKHIEEMTKIKLRRKLLECIK